MHLLFFNCLIGSTLRSYLIHKSPEIALCVGDKNKQPVSWQYMLGIVHTVYYTVLDSTLGSAVDRLSTALHCTTLHCTTLHCTALSGKQDTGSSRPGQCQIINYRTVQYNSVGCSAVCQWWGQCCAVQCTRLHCKVLYDSVGCTMSNSISSHITVPRADRAKSKYISVVPVFTHIAV
jgi:hypothetical protein